MISRLHKCLLGIFLVSLLIMSGCGSTTQTQVPTEAKKGILVININPTSSRLIPSSATKVLVRVFNSNQNILKDADIPNDGSPIALQIPLPIGTYTVQIISYKGNDEALTIGSSENILVQANTNTSVRMTLVRPTFSITQTKEGSNITSLKGGESFTLNYTINKGTFPFYDWAYLDSWMDGNNLPTKTLYPNESPWSITVPSQPTTGTFTYKIRTVLPMDKYGKYLYLDIPSASCGESLMSLTVTPPEGGIIIDVD